MCKKYELGIEKFKPGQVWFCNEAPEVTTILREHGARAINGARPYVIVKVNGGIVNCCPLTTNTVSSDPLENDICFHNPLDNCDSRILISQISTKGIGEFSKYLFSFDEDATKTIVSLIQTCLFGKNNVEVNVEDHCKNEELYEEAIKGIKIFSEAEDELLKDVEERLKSKSALKITFKSPQEAAVWYNKWGHEKACKVAQYFGVTNSKVYNWKHIAKKIINK